MDENGGSVSSNSISNSFQAASVQQTGEMVSSDVPVGVNNSASGSVKQDSKVRKKKSKKWLVVLIILVVLAGGGVGLLFFDGFSERVLDSNNDIDNSDEDEYFKTITESENRKIVQKIDDFEKEINSASDDKEKSVIYNERADYLLHESGDYGEYEDMIISDLLKAYSLNPSSSLAWSLYDKLCFFEHQDEAQKYFEDYLRLLEEEDR